MEYTFKKNNYDFMVNWIKHMSSNKIFIVKVKTSVLVYFRVQLEFDAFICIFS